MKNEIYKIFDVVLKAFFKISKYTLFEGIY